ncbi:MAG: PAS domain S-box protein [Alphaproteobacteria bacterium]|nr:PAS domain S-box protein [Alphaproteobacteria bacterium]
MPAGRFEASAVLEHMADGFVAFDSAWNCIFVNSAAEAAFGLSRSDLLGRNHWDSPISLAGTRAEIELRRVMADQVVSSFDMEFAGKLFNFRLYPLPEQSLAVRLRDITAQRRGEERLQLALDTTGLGLWDHEIAVDRLFWDERTRAMCGVPADAPIDGMTTFERLLHREDRNWVLAAYRAALDPSGAGLFDCEFRVIGLTNSIERWLLASGRTIFDRHRAPVRMLGTVLDITERKLAEQRLQQNEERLRLAVSATGLGTWDHDVATGRRTWSETARELLGLPPDIEASRELLGALLHPEDEPRTDEQYRRAFDPQHGGEYQNEFRIRRYDNGEERWLSLHGRVLFDANHRATRALGIVRDVTEEKRTEATLRQLNETLEARVAQRTGELEQANQELSAERTRLGAILQQLPFGVIVATRTGAIAFQNMAARQMMGRDVSGVGEWQDFAGIGAVSSEGRPLDATEYALVRAVRDGAVTERKLQPFSSGEGKLVMFEVSAAPVRDAGGEIVLGVVALEDVTARLEAEEALRRAQRMEAIGQLTGGVAHDFNNLLTAILGNLEILGRRVTEPRILRLVENATRAADRGAKLTAQLLAFARKQRLQPQAVDLNQLVQSMGTLLRSTLGGTVEVDVEPAPDLRQALADPTQLELVVLNLAINARDAMPDGGRLTIRTENATILRPSRPEDPPPGNFVALTVADAGVGMTADVLARVFEPFFTTKEVGKGSGLGLPQVLGLAQQLGGGVRIASEPGRGTSVTVYLPQARAEDTAVAKAAGEGGLSSLAGLSLLLVEDDPDVREITADLLQELGASVVLAANGVEALERVDSHFDAVLLDFAMPQMNGAELAGHIRQLYAGLPLLLVTGHSDDLVVPNTVSVLRKPFQTAELALAIRRAIATGRTSRV